MPLLRVLKARPLPVPHRLFHSTACAKHLVGPPDPISNLRPVIYDDNPSHSSSSPPTKYQHSSQLRHPYSLQEFTTGDNRDYQWKLQSQQLDAFDHQFWLDNNSRLQEAKAAVLAALPKNTTPQDREFILGEFYRDWLIQESPRLTAYNAEWRKRNFHNIVLAARAEWAKFWSYLGF